MKKHFNIFAFLLLIVIIRPVSASANDSLLYWGRKLNFNDYKGSPGPAAVEYALSFVGFDFNYSFDSAKRLTFSVKAYFDPDRSWSRSTDTITLQHEQMHFDLAEIIARQLCAELGRNRELYTSHDSVAAIVDRYNRKLVEWHYQYDAETIYSADIRQHKRWRRKLDRLLTRLPAECRTSKDPERAH